LQLISTPKELNSLVDDYGPDEQFLKVLSGHIFESLQTSESIGRSLILQQDLSLSKKKIPTQTRVVASNAQWFLCDGGPIKVSFDLIPKEALDYLRQKSLMIAGVEQEQLLQEVKNKFVQAIKEGKTFDEFKAEIDRIFDAYGVTRLSYRHLETVFRTNLFSSYAIGQLKQVQSMQDRFPLWKYSAILDARTRPEHRALNGMIFRVGEGPIPPIDYNCRCTSIYLHISQVESQGLTPVEWKSNPPFVRFDNAAGFDEWQNSKKEALTPAVNDWIQANS
jgi:SPP1 gp7 family putative phage head morphogenesis protein